MSELLARYPGISGSITTYKHDAFVDSKYAWKIVGQDAEIERLIVELRLQETTIGHARFKELQGSIPEAWDMPDAAGTKVYVSPPYGVDHQDGTDLLLLVRDPQSAETFALYEWIF